MDQHKIQIRHYRSSDDDAVRDLFQKHKSIRRNLVCPTADNSYLKANDFWEVRKVLLIDDKIIGFVFGSFLSRSRDFSIEGLAIHPKYRKMHLGSRLLQSCIKDAIERFSPPRVTLLCVNDVVPFYKKCGFTHNGTFKEHLFYQTYQDANYMVKVIRNIV